MERLWDVLLAQGVDPAASGWTSLFEARGALRRPTVLLHARAEKCKVATSLREQVLRGSGADLGMGEADCHVERFAAQFPHLDDRDAGRLQ